MTEPIEIVGIDELRPRLDRGKVLACVREALVWQAEGKVQSPLPGQLLFEEPHGDCHIKFGHAEGSDTFTVKVATGFYENPKRGLPVNFGLVLVLDAETGAPKLLFNDEGWLTAWRTAAATAIAAATLVPPSVERVGVIGTGLQASLALEWLPDTLGNAPFSIWGRSPEKAERLAAQASQTGCDARAAREIDEIFATCNVVITATPSKDALFLAESVRPGTHMVGIGADSPGKQEIPAELFSHAAHILTDDRPQSIDHGDFGHAVREGLVAEDRALMLGDVLSGGLQPERKADDVTIADLTGIAAEDIAIAGLFYRLLN